MRKQMTIIQRLLCGVFLSSISFMATADEALTFSLNRLEDGKVVKVTEKSFADKYLLMAVGFTGCPDICPTTMLDMRGALAELDKTPEKAAQLQPLFITIDPTSDTLKDITEYAAYFDPRIVGLRADDFKTLDNVVNQLHASYGYTFNNKAVLPPNLPKGYTVSHSIYLYLYSPERKLLDVFPYNMEGKVLAKNISKYLK